MSPLLRFSLLLLLGAGAVLQAQNIPANIAVTPKVTTTSVKNDADDPAIWVHPSQPSKSVIIGTDKSGSNSGLYVWDMNGKQLQFVPVEEPNNVDVRYGIRFGNRTVDVAVTNMRAQRQMRVFEINPVDGTLSDLTTATGIKTPELQTPYGLCLYRRSDGALFVFASSKDGSSRTNLHQYRLRPDGAGKVKGEYVRALGNGIIQDVVEGMAADDALGYLYAAEEGRAVRKFYADPASGKSEQITAFASDDGIDGDREGVAVYGCSDGTGYILISSQGNTTVKVYRREGENGDPHKHTLVTTIETKGSSETDGLDVTNRPTSAQFPHGLLVTHHSPGKQFNLYAWEDIARDYLTVCTAGAPATAVAEQDSRGPAALTLAQNFPNPFNPATQIRFHLAAPGRVSLVVFDLLGQRVRTLVSGERPAGDAWVQWDGRDEAGAPVASGTYLYQLRSGEQVLQRKLVLLR